MPFLRRALNELGGTKTSTLSRTNSVACPAERSGGRASPSLPLPAYLGLDAKQARQGGACCRGAIA
jgi:hypothetical protein